jgi:stage V sporulation protein G
MKITEVRIFSAESRDGKLKAFATMTFDDWFVVRNVKIIQGNNGLFVAMPSRKAMVPCPKCRFKNVRGSRFCNQCGARMGHAPVTEDTEERQGSHMDIAHPITQECREYIQDTILEAYESENGKDLPAEGQEHMGPESTPDIDL